MKTRLISVLATLGLFTLVVTGLDLAHGRVPLPLARVAEAAGCPPDVVFGCLLSGSGAHGWRVNNSTTAADAAGIVGQITSTAPGRRSTGVRGINNATSVQGYGVYGSHAGGGHGVLGTTISGMGVYGSATSGTGVYGRHSNTTGAAPGVQGDTSSTAEGAAGVLGRATATRANAGSAGVRGYNGSTDGTGSGVAGEHASNGWAVIGRNGAGNVGGLATTLGGVVGMNDIGNKGVLATESEGVYGEAYAGAGVHGFHFGTTGTGSGVLGETYSTGAYAAGVQGKATDTGTNEGSIGVWGYNASTSNTGSGVFGEHAGSGWAVRAKNGLGNLGGLATDVAGAHGLGADNGTGVYGEANGGTSATGVWGKSSTGWAGWFDGKVRVNGNFSVANGTKQFVIDHPLDPANQYLYHAAIESSERLNLYNGNATLDANGEAWVELPAWFEALNGDFRYQLTTIGGFAPVYIAEKIQGNRFKIAGGTEGLEVSWQVTGTRRDAWAAANPFEVEVPKAEVERGFYLAPESFGQTEEQGIQWATRGEQMRALRAQRPDAPPPAPDHVP